MIIPRKKSLLIGFVLLGILLGGGMHMSTRPTLSEMVGQMIMTGFHGDGTDLSDENFIAICDQISTGQIGGVILFDVDVHGLVSSGVPISAARTQIFSSNIKNMPQVRALTRHLTEIAPRGLLVAVDQEGGTVMRLKPPHGFISTPSPAEMGAGQTSETYAIAHDMGTRLRELGINVNFAPSLDVNVNPESPIIGARGRSFSENPATVASHAAAFARGLDDAGIAYAFKHFPGHGSAGTDSHMGMTDITNTYDDVEMIPWHTVLPRATSRAMVMVAHVINTNIDDVPASLSRPTIQQIRDMGFDGVIVSDDMDMGAIANEYGLRTAVRMAIDAGNDVLVFGNNLTFDKNRGRDINMMITDMVRRGEIPRSRIRESYRRIMRMKRGLQ